VHTAFSQDDQDFFACKGAKGPCSDGTPRATMRGMPRGVDGGAAQQEAR